MEITLDRSPVGRKTTIKTISAEPMGVRLMELGMTPGMEVKVLFKAPGGCPLAVAVGKDYVLGLRKEAAELGM